MYIYICTFVYTYIYISVYIHIYPISPVCLVKKEHMGVDQNLVAAVFIKRVLRSPLRSLARARFQQYMGFKLRIISAIIYAQVTFSYQIR